MGIDEVVQYIVNTLRASLPTINQNLENERKKLQVLEPVVLLSENIYGHFLAPISSFPAILVVPSQANDTFDYIQGRASYYTVSILGYIRHVHPRAGSRLRTVLADTVEEILQAKWRVNENLPDGRPLQYENLPIVSTTYMQVPLGGAIVHGFEMVWRGVSVVDLV